LAVSSRHRVCVVFQAHKIRLKLTATLQRLARPIDGRRPYNLKIHWRAIIADVASGCSRTYLLPPLSSGGAARRNLHKEKRSNETHAAANDYLDKHPELIEEAAQRMREPAFAALLKVRKLYPSGVPLRNAKSGRGTRMARPPRNADQAYRVMMTAHQKGACVIAVYVKDVAETKAKEGGWRQGLPVSIASLTPTTGDPNGRGLNRNILQTLSPKHGRCVATRP
jgi:ATP-dependent Clp protease adaptor protein ClpS